jgi:hypothetical protein
MDGGITAGVVVGQVMATPFFMPVTPPQTAEEVMALAGRSTLSLTPFWAKALLVRQGVIKAKAPASAVKTWRAWKKKRRMTFSGCCVLLTYKIARQSANSPTKTALERSIAARVGCPAPFERFHGPENGFLAVYLLHCQFIPSYPATNAKDTMSTGPNWAAMQQQAINAEQSRLIAAKSQGLGIAAGNQVNTDHRVAQLERQLREANALIADWQASMEAWKDLAQALRDEIKACPNAEAHKFGKDDKTRNSHAMAKEDAERVKRGLKPKYATTE